MTSQPVQEGNRRDITPRPAPNGWSTYEYLLERVWGREERRRRGPHSRAIVSKLRHKLGEDGDNPVCISRVGYRMPRGETRELQKT